MKIGFVGLGKMGANMIQRLLNGGHEIVAYARTAESVKKAEEKGAVGAKSFDDLVNKLNPPRVLWLMVPAGDTTEKVAKNVTTFLDRGDILIDGGNSFYKDSMRRAKGLEDKGISFLDVGTSGGIWGLKVGYCLMIGGNKKAFEKAEPLFQALAPESGYAHVGPNGAGHFVKMVHNGIEYAMLQGYAEGFNIMKAKTEFNLDLNKVARLWNRGSVIRSWLLELTENIFEKDPDLDSIRGYVEDSGEGRWTVAEAIEQNVPAPLITLSLLERFRSRQDESFSAKVIAALRNEFGGHAVKKE
ncbi:MAG: decarboxylating 6-phosphogluconate dehydrogenase [Thermodesulfovibrionia bacterium]|nr:decarboxylating 6-phosphogluconate dehydrogenase [Thermodesulfovibrionia bacterium]